MNNNKKESLSGLDIPKLQSCQNVDFGFFPRNGACNMSSLSFLNSNAAAINLQMAASHKLAVFAN